MKKPAKLGTGRRLFDRDAVRGVKGFFVVFVATALGAGLLPWAPGTMGTIVGIPIAYFTRDWPAGARVPLWLAIFALGTWAAETFDRAMGTQDNQNIVIDEVVGLGITAWTLTGPAGMSAQGWIAAFLLFRLFDVWKPFPIRLLDQWSHRAIGRWADGFGVMADDALAGIYGLIVMMLLQRAGFLL